jgi:hypothetical protein
LHESQKREIKNTFCFFYVAILLSRWRGLCANWNWINDKCTLQEEEIMLIDRMISDLLSSLLLISDI